MLTVKEASEIYGISPHAIRRWIKENAFPVVHTGRKVFINRIVFWAYLGGA
ncbi:helix-turn-helix domain-containing protein [Ruminococcus sp.]|uniref:helix-turn-helix domain-containing protein n=1 Tax=Ruminococcus sp. TaxID=41978 RepID=UPI003AB34129